MQFLLGPFKSYDGAWAGQQCLALGLVLAPCSSVMLVIPFASLTTTYVLIMHAVPPRAFQKPSDLAVCLGCRSVY